MSGKVAQRAFTGAWLVGIWGASCHLDNGGNAWARWENGGRLPGVLVDAGRLASALTGISGRRPGNPGLSVSSQQGHFLPGFGTHFQSLCGFSRNTCNLQDQNCDMV